MASIPALISLLPLLLCILFPWSPACAGDKEGRLPAIHGGASVFPETESSAPQGDGGHDAIPDTDILPRGLLFQPLMADPRWPRFSASYQHYLDRDLNLEHVGSATFGETFSLVRHHFQKGGWIDLGIQAGVFSIFDLSTSSSDLINSDFLVSVPVSYRSGRFSALFRIFHQSSHLGDEFLLRETVERVGHSYESLHLLLSRDFGPGFRIYGGGGYVFRTSLDFRPWSLQGGLEYRSRSTWWSGRVRPLTALDLQHSEENDWRANLSLKTGLQFENPNLMGRKLLLLLEYYNGHSPDGQFFNQTIHFLGLGVHLHLY
jgi:hypothetical protein